MNKEVEEQVNTLVKEAYEIKKHFIIDYFDEKEKVIKLYSISEEEYDKEKGAHQFPIKYQKWYSKCLLILKAILQERLSEFVNCYEPPRNRKELSILNYTISDAIEGIYNRNKNLDSFTAFNKLDIQINIISSLKGLLESKINEITNIIEYEVFEDELKSAGHLNKNGYHRSAGAICGVVLERHLKRMLIANNIKYKEKTVLSELIQSCYENKIIDSTQYKFLIYMSDIRNKCDHDKDSEPTSTEVDELISGTNKVVSTY